MKIKIAVLISILFSGICLAQTSTLQIVNGGASGTNGAINIAVQNGTNSGTAVLSAGTLYINGVAGGKIGVTQVTGGAWAVNAVLSGTASSGTFSTLTSTSGTLYLGTGTLTQVSGTLKLNGVPVGTGGTGGFSPPITIPVSQNIFTTVAGGTFATDGNGNFSLTDTSGGGISTDGSGNLIITTSNNLNINADTVNVGNLNATVTIGGNVNIDDLGDITIPSDASVSQASLTMITSNGDFLLNGNSALVNSDQQFAIDTAGALHVTADFSATGENIDVTGSNGLINNQIVVSGTMVSGTALVSNAFIDGTNCIPVLTGSAAFPPWLSYSGTTVTIHSFGSTATFQVIILPNK